MCCGILEWAQSWSFLGEKVALVCECLDWAALLAVCLLVVRQTTCYKNFDRYDLSVCTCVCIQETMKEREKETKVSDSRDGRGAWFTGVTAVWMNAWVHVHCACLRTQVQTDAWKKKSCSEGNICLPFNQTAEEGCWRAKLVACCYHTRLYLFKFYTPAWVWKGSESAAVPLECLYIPIMLWFFCTPVGLYKDLLINHKKWSTLLKSVPVSIFRRPVLPCKMIWFSSFITCAFILWRKNWIIVIEGLNIIRYINVFLGSTMWPSYTLTHHAHCEKCHVRFWVMSQKVFRYRFFKKQLDAHKRVVLLAALETGSVSIVANRFSGKCPARPLALMSS